MRELNIRMKEESRPVRFRGLTEWTGSMAVSSFVLGMCVKHLEHLFACGFLDFGFYF